MIHRTDTPPAEAFAFVRMGATLAHQTPRTLRGHIGQRAFGDFGAVLLADRSASGDLSARVARWRDRDEAGRPIIRGIDYLRPAAPIQPHPDQLTDDRRLGFALKITTAALASWITLGLIVAHATGRF